MTDRTSPYSAFNFLVEFQGVDIAGGFSEVSGLGAEITMAEYRNGNDPLNCVGKVAGLTKSTDVVLKRGIMNSRTAFEWLTTTSRQGGDAGKRTVIVTLNDESGKTPVQKWTLNEACPIKYTGPTLSGKGGTDVAMEEITLSVRSVVPEQVG